MTGFSTVSGAGPSGEITLEMRSVNSRFLELHFRLPDELRVAEPLIRERLQQRLSRGKVDVRASLRPGEESASHLRLNHDLLLALGRAQQEIQSSLPLATPLTVADVLRFPGMVAESAVCASQTLESMGSIVNQCVQGLSDSRAREGERLRTIILQKLQAMHEVVRNHAERAPELLRLYEARLQERLRQAAESPLMDMKLPMEETLARIRQEVALHGMKTDVVEELQRLAIHLQEFEAILQRGGPVGRKLDFLLQELNREANTLGSKSADLPSTAASLELKLLIEQVREQIQNLE
ncbi:MAG: YicC/YloC family endoribonuclease [Burkholderiaceae bacterium]